MLRKRNKKSGEIPRDNAVDKRGPSEVTAEKMTFMLPSLSFPSTLDSIDSQRSPASPGTSGKTPENRTTPFEFLRGTAPDLVAIIHAVILSSLPAYDKHEICMKIARNSDAFCSYMEWRKKMAKTPPPGCLDNLPLDVRDSVRNQLRLLDYKKVREMCRQYPLETVDLSTWLDIILDKKFLRYLDFVFERARNILETFLKNGIVPEDVPENPSSSTEKKVQETPVKVQRTAEERKTRGLIEKLAPTLAEAILNLEQKKNLDQKKLKPEKIAAIEAEKTFILNACVQLSVFLNDNSIDEDSFVKAMIFLAEKEKKAFEGQHKQKKSRDPSFSHNLENICFEHMENVKRAMERTHAPLTVDEVHKLISNLTKLKISGQLITAARRQ